ncbi:MULTISPECIES: hypothetical protein [unclassified Corynebacterium]|uniref:hypothetical protein n=1 Tax=unclassified Corynebacterium TaxID=2624378 RepID=UPI003F8FD54E
MTSRSVTSVDVEFRGADVAGRPVPVITGTVDLPGDARGLSPQEFREAGVPVALFAHCFTCNDWSGLSTSGFIIDAGQNVPASLASRVEMGVSRVSYGMDAG